MVSPETDSGFVGSESSRVSLLARTPEHQPLGTGYGTSTTSLLHAMGQWGGRGSGCCGWEVRGASLTHPSPGITACWNLPSPLPSIRRRRKLRCCPPGRR